MARMEVDILFKGCPQQKMKKHALLATLWFNLALRFEGMALIIVGVVSIVMFPVIPDSYSELGTKAGYPLVMNMLLGPG